MTAGVFLGICIVLLLFLALYNDSSGMDGSSGAT